MLRDVSCTCRELSNRLFEDQLQRLSVGVSRMSIRCIHEPEGAGKESLLSSKGVHIGRCLM